MPKRTRKQTKEKHTFGIVRRGKKDLEFQPANMPASSRHRRKRTAEQPLEGRRDLVRYSRNGSNFQYSRLDDPSNQIRLLRLSKNPEDNGMDCIMTTHDIRNLPVYYAISYTWGDAKPLMGVNVNGKNMSVRSNCCMALRQVQEYLERRHGPETYVWIDSICINQRDLQEKSSQVQRMGDVYSQAALVVIPFGPHADDSDLLFDHANHLCSLMEQTFGWTVAGMIEEARLLVERFGTKQFGDVDGYILQAFQSWTDNILPERTKLTDAIMKFGQRSYWSRAWILQEVLSAQQNTVLSGYSETSCEKIQGLLSVMIFARCWHEELKCWKKELKGFERIFEDDVYELPMHKVISSTIRGLTHGRYLGEVDISACSDVRDRIYSAISILEYDDRLGPIVPDYHNTTEEVARQAVRHWACFLKLVDVYHLVVGLKLHSDCLYDSLIYHSCLKCQPRTAIATSPNTTCGCVKQLIPTAMVTSTVFGLTRVDRNAEGRFVANIARYDINKFIFPGEHHTYQSNIGEISNLQFTLCSLVRSGDLIGALASNQPGDLGSYLVLRKHTAQVYEIIGRAALCPYPELALTPDDFECHPCKIDLQDDPQSHDIELSTYMNLHMDPDDAIAWAAVDALSYFPLRFQLSCTRERFSSFASPCGWSERPRNCANCGESSERPSICATCGGLVLGSISSEEEDAEKPWQAIS